MDSQIAKILSSHSQNLASTTKARQPLSTWQGIYMWEHACDPHQRKVIVAVLGQ
jgi:thiamine phosphate synthase YjbQ (UPF0047 family)